MSGGWARMLGAASAAWMVAGAAVAQSAATTPTSATGKILQPIQITKVRDLSFGTVTRPVSGGSLVAIAAADGARTITGGNGSLVNGGSPGRAEFQVFGEGGQAYQVTAPIGLTLTRSGGGETLAVDLTTTPKTGLFPGGLGATGMTTFGVGGSLTLYPQTVSGDYQGTFAITVAYN